MFDGLVMNDSISFLCSQLNIHQSCSVSKVRPMRCHSCVIIYRIYHLYFTTEFSCYLQTCRRQTVVYTRARLALEAARQSGRPLWLWQIPRPKLSSERCPIQTNFRPHRPSLSSLMLVTTASLFPGINHIASEILLSRATRYKNSYWP